MAMLSSSMPPTLPALTAELNAASFAQALTARADIRIEFRGPAIVCRPRDASVAHRLRTVIVDAPLWDGDALVLDAVDALYAARLFGEEGLSVELAERIEATDA